MLSILNGDVCVERNVGMKKMTKKQLPFTLLCQHRMQQRESMSVNSHMELKNGRDVYLLFYRSLRHETFDQNLILFYLC